MFWNVVAVSLKAIYKSGEANCFNKQSPDLSILINRSLALTPVKSQGRRSWALKELLFKEATQESILLPSYNFTILSEGCQVVKEGESSSGNSLGHIISCLLSDMSLLSPLARTHSHSSGGLEPSGLSFWAFLCACFPNATSDGILLVAWDRPSWEYGHHGNRQILQMKAFLIWRAKC